MGIIINLTKRNTLMFLKDKSAVFFSFLSVIIIIGLYVVFLADNNIKAVQNLMKVDRKLVAYLVNSWVLAGIVIVNSVTVTLGVLGIMVDDEAENRMPSFLVSPVGRWQLTLGYIFSAFVVGNILCIITFVLSQMYILISGGSLLGSFQILKALGIIIISVFSSTCFVFFIVSLIRSRNAFSTASTIIGTVIGFVTGIYIPVGELPKMVQQFIKCVPAFYGSSLMRDTFMEDPVSKVFNGAPSNVISSYLETSGVKIVWNSTVTDFEKTAVVIISGIVFMALSVLVMRNRRISRV